MVVAEIYRETNIKARERVGSAAFNLEYQERFRSQPSIRDDLTSYLGEYRFEIPKYEYPLFYSRDDRTGEFSVLAKDQESMIAKSQRAIRERKLRGEPTHREENETLGLLNFERQLAKARVGDTIFWASPPGPEEEGYGDYGFIYKGTIQEGTIRMAALRVENPTISQYNMAMAALTGVWFDFREADEFLRSPHVVDREVSDLYTEYILKQEFSYSPNEEKQKEFEFIIGILEPLIDRAIFAIQHGSKEEKLSTFYVLENYAMELRDKSHELVLRKGINYSLRSHDLDYISTQSYEPPVARGSCGSTSTQSNMLFSGDPSLNSMLTHDKYGDREFKCPKCHQVNVRPMNELLEKCQHCGSTEVSCEETSSEQDYYQEAA